MKITALTVGPVGTNCYLVSDGNGDAAVCSYISLPLSCCWKM